MRALSLDYRRSKAQAQHWVGMLLLVLVIAGAVQMERYYRQLSEQGAQLEALAAKIEHKLHPSRSVVAPSAAESQQTGAEIKAANEVLLQLNLPWNEMFAAVEGANNDDMALLGIEPDVKKGLVRVSGEAKNSAAMFKYIRLLQGSKPISTLYLKHHQIKERDPEKPIRFTLDASWAEKH